MRPSQRVLLGCGLLFLAGCSRLVLPSVTLGGRAGFDLAQRRHTSLTAHLALVFALPTAAPVAAHESFGAVPDSLPVARAGDAVCRYVRRAADAELSALPEVP
jgi:hypothetical protein